MGSAGGTSQAIFCEACGAPRGPGARFCAACGEEVEPEDDGEEHSVETTRAALGLERFSVQGVLGRGGAGTVYLALDAVSGEDVALKVLASHLAKEPTAKGRFLAEGRLLASLSHPHLVQVIDCGEDAGRPWIALSYVEGATLEALLEHEGVLSKEQCLSVVTGALSALAFVHHQGLVHGDVSPSNILVDHYGVSKLSDFGQSLASGGRSVGGTPSSLSPEAAAGRPLDARSDVYSAGAVLFSCLAGRPPFEGPPEALIHQHAMVPAPRLEGVGQAMADLVASCLAKDPQHRPADAGELLERLEVAAMESFGADWRRRGSLVGLAALAGFESAALLDPHPAPARPQAVGSARSHRAPRVTAASRPKSHPMVKPSRADSPRPVSAPRAHRASRLTRTAKALASHKVLTAGVAAVTVGVGVGAGVAALKPQTATPAPSSAPPTTAGPAPQHTLTWALQDMPPEKAGLVGAVGGFSCPTVTRCLALTGYQTAGSGQPSPTTDVYGFDPTTSSTTALGPAPQGTDPGQLSCPTVRWCMAAGSGDFAVTVDGGESWRAEPPPPGGDGAADVVSCVTTATCMVVSAPSDGQGQSLRAWTTGDGGQSWHQGPAFTSSSAEQLDCVTAANCWLLTGPGLLVTSDAGQRWTPVTGFGGATTPFSATSVGCLDALRCFVGLTADNDTSGTVATTGDGGRSWSLHRLAAEPYGVDDVDVACSTGRTCVAAVVYAQDQEHTYDAFYATDDGWSSFSTIANPPRTEAQQRLELVDGLTCPSATRCVAAFTGVNAVDSGPGTSALGVLG